VTRESEDPWSVLGINPDASLDEIGRAYRDLVGVWRPDRFSSDPRLQKIAEEKMKEIDDAYQLLKTRYTVPLKDAPKSRSSPTQSDQTTTTSTSSKAPVQTGAGSAPRRSQVPTWLIVPGIILILRFLATLIGTPPPVVNTPSPPSLPTMPPVVSEVPQEPSIKQEKPPNVPSQAPPQNAPRDTNHVRLIETSKEPNDKTASSSKVDSFAIGSTKDEVRTIQGTPTSVHKGAFTETWWYGSSYVEFDQSGRVTSYSSAGGNLRIRVAPKILITSDHFTIGSLKDEVLSVQGTPTSIRKGAYTETWWYGSSYVEFDQLGRVRGYSNTARNLRVR
jgi:outer membrane protein assembly factor BamE (lipoprotein component of BamABCDE complex)